MRRIPIAVLAVVLMLVASHSPLLPSIPTKVAGYTFNNNNPQPLFYTTLAEHYPGALQAADGTLWIVWQQYYDQGYFMTQKAGLWSSIQPLPTGSQFIIAPALAQLQNSSITLFWSSNQTGHFNIYYKLYSNNVWRNTVQLTSGSFDDLFPSAAVSTNSTLWLFWERISGATYQLYYKTLTGNKWSSEKLLSSSTNEDIQPNALATYNGKIWVTWSRLDSSGNFDVFYRIFDGTTWSSEVPLTNAGTWDLEPAIVQDRNGTIWIFWSRQMSLPNAQYQQKLWYKFTDSSGVSWSPDTQLTFYGVVDTTLDDLEPSVVQGVDKSLWIFFSSDYPLGSVFEIYYIKSNAILNHDVDLAGIQAPPFWYPGGLKSVGEGQMMKVNVTVADTGGYNENVQVSLTISNATSYSFGPVTGMVLAGKSSVFTFYWNTTLVKLGRYSMTASVSPVPGEINTADNSLTIRNITHIIPLGDVDQDGSVSIVDVAIADFDYGSIPGSPRWNPYCDIDGNGIIDIVDISVAVLNYGMIS